jgi:hypothetical protein
MYCIWFSKIVRIVTLNNINRFVLCMRSVSAVAKGKVKQFLFMLAHALGFSGGSGFQI